MVLANLNEGFYKREVDIFTVRKLFGDLRRNKALELFVVKKLVVVSKSKDKWKNVEFTGGLTLEIDKSENAVSTLL